MKGKRDKIITVLLHAILITIVYVFQGMIFPYMRLYGFVPLILPVVSTGIAVYEGRYAGGIAGIVAGVLCDVSLNEPAGMFTVLLTITGLLTGALADTVMTRGFATFVICCAAVLVVSALVQIFPLVFFEYFPLQTLLPTAIRQTVYSILFTLPLWFFVRALGRRAQRLTG